MEEALDARKNLHILTDRGIRVLAVAGDPLCFSGKDIFYWTAC
jgi:hypothetical protein